MTETFPPAPAGGTTPVIAMRQPWRQSIIRPIQAFQRNYVPVVMVYFAYGALGLIDVTRDLWIKESLSFTPSQLAGLGVWFTLPWTVKMVFGELVDAVPIFGSQRKSYIIAGAVLMAAGNEDTEPRVGQLNTRGTVRRELPQDRAKQGNPHEAS